VYGSCHSLPGIENLKVKVTGHSQRCATRVSNVTSYEYWLAAVVVGFHCDMSCELANFDPSGVVLTSILKLKPKVVVFLKVWAYRCNLVKSHINFKNLFYLFIAFCFSLFTVLSIYHCCWLIDVFRTSQNDQLYCTVIILESLLIHYVLFKQLLETGVGSLSWES